MLVFAISLTWDIALINKPRVVIFFPFFVLKQLNTATMHFLPDMQNHEFGNQTIEMHFFARENQTYTGTWLFGVDSWKSLKGQENLLLKNLQVKTPVENFWFLSWRIFLLESTVFKAPTKWLLKDCNFTREFSISHHQISCAHAIVIQRIHACACKMPSCWAAVASTITSI